MSESQTPRTDEAVQGMPNQNRLSPFVSARFARQLESELTTTRARLAELEGIAEQAICRFGCTCGEFGMCPLCSDVIKRYEAYKEGKK